MLYLIFVFLRSSFEAVLLLLLLLHVSTLTMAQRLRSRNRPKPYRDSCLLLAIHSTLFATVLLDGVSVLQVQV